MTGRGSGKRGRPLGFKLTETSKIAISQSKFGQLHKQSTKDKISKSLILYFKNRNPLSDEMTANYYRIDSNHVITDWIDDNSENIDSMTDVLTEKVIQSKGKIEIACGNTIEFFSHSITPELIIMFKEYCDLNGKDFDDAISELND